MSGKKLKSTYTYERNYDTDDDEWNRDCTEQRRDKRAKEERKRKKYEEEVKKQRDSLCGKGVIGVYAAQLQQFTETVNTPELMRFTVSEVGKKVGKRMLMEWAEKLSSEINGLPQYISTKTPLGLHNVLPLEVFNNWLQDGKFPKFTKDNYVVKVDQLLDMEDYHEVLRDENKHPTMHLKADREKSLKKHWDDFLTKKMIKAVKRGMVIKGSEFKRLNKKRVESSGFSEEIAWKEYKKTWCLLMGLKPAANLWVFFSRVKILPSMLSASVKEVVVAASTQEETESGVSTNEGEEGVGATDGPYPNEDDDMVIPPDYFGEDNDAGWAVAGAHGMDSGGEQMEEAADDGGDMEEAADDGGDMEEAAEMEEEEATEMLEEDEN
jgi:hypothetical protein